MNLELEPESLRWHCDPKTLGCSSSKEVKPLGVIIGQARAIKALQFGLGIKEFGFNVFVAGNFLVDKQLTTFSKRMKEVLSDEGKGHKTDS